MYCNSKWLKSLLIIFSLNYIKIIQYLLIFSSFVYHLNCYRWKNYHFVHSLFLHLWLKFFSAKSLNTIRHFHKKYIQLWAMPIHLPLMCLLLMNLWELTSHLLFSLVTEKSIWKLFLNAFVEIRNSF